MRGPLLIAAGVLWAFAQMMPDRACGQDAPAIIHNRDRQDAFVSLYVRTRQCMEAAGVAMLRHGVSAPAPTQHFMAESCGDGMRLFLQDDGMRESEARTYVALLTRTAYYRDVLRIPEPPLHPNAPKE